MAMPKPALHNGFSDKLHHRVIIIITLRRGSKQQPKKSEIFNKNIFIEDPQISIRILNNQKCV